MSNLRSVLTVVVAVAVFAPTLTHAAVVINEIAWMGSSDNANAEWIELYNDGSDAVSLSGWTITSSGTAPNITIGSGKSIPGNGYFLFERTSDASVPNVSADQIYTGALSNSGDTLALKDASGTVIDQVVGGTNWGNIGGDNATKKTAQRSGSSWVTADPTPKAANAAGESSDDETGTTTPETNTGTTTPVVTVGGSAPSTSNEASPVRALYLDAGTDRIVPVNTETPFRAVAYRKGGNISTDADISWNFGDGIRESGEETTHIYTHPGEYVVTVRAVDGEANVLKTLRVVAEAYDAVLELEEDGIAVMNNSGRLLDLSGWALKTPEGSYTIPDDTAIWPHARVVFGNNVTNLSPTTTASLIYPNGKLAFARTEEDTKEPEEEPVIATLQPVSVPVGIQEVRYQPLPVNEKPHYEEVVTAPAEPTLTASVGAAVAPVPLKPSWLLCLFGSLLACGASLVVP